MPFRLPGLTKAAWDESKHPRGQPGNPGQFGRGRSGKRTDPVRSGLHPDIQRHYDLLRMGTPEERAAKARHIHARIMEGRRAAGAPHHAAAGGHGTLGHGHPMAGLDPKAQRQRLADARSGLDEGKPLGIDEAGPPDGLDMDKFGGHAAEVMARHAEATSSALDMPEAYEAIGKPFGLSKHDFLRAITAAHRSGHIRLGGWGQTTDEIPDPELVTQVSDKLFYFVNPGGTRKAAFRLPGLVTKAHDEAKHPRDDHGRWVAKLTGHIAALQGHAHEHASADALIAQLQALPQAKLYAVLKDAGIEGIRPTDNKGRLLQYARNRLTARARARERAEV